MIITQDKLINQIAYKRCIDIDTVKNIFKTAEDIIFDNLSSISPSENITIKLLKGISIERKYIPKKTYTKGMFKDLDCAEHVNVKVNLSKYFCKKVNDGLTSKKLLL